MYKLLHSSKIDYSKNHSNFTKMFVFKLFKTTANKTEYSRLEQWSVVKFWWLRSANHMKFTDECVMCCLEEHV